MSQEPSVVRLQLGVPQLRALIPEGSEAEVKLIGGVMENYAKSIADRIARQLEAERGRTVAAVLAELERKTWGGELPAISAAAKAQIAVETKAYLAAQIAMEVRKHCTVNEITEAVKAEVVRVAQGVLSVFSVRDHVRAEIREAIKAEVSKLSLKDLLK